MTCLFECDAKTGRTTLFATSDHDRSQRWSIRHSGFRLHHLALHDFAKSPLRHSWWVTKKPGDRDGFKLMACIFLSRIFLSASWFLRNADRKIRDRKIEPVKPIGRAATTINRQGGELQNSLWAKSSRQESIHLFTKLERRAEHPGLAGSVGQLHRVRRTPGIRRVQTRIDATLVVCRIRRPSSGPCWSDAIRDSVPCE